MDMNELVTQQRDILLRKIFKAFFTENIGITTAIDQSGMPRATFYSVPEVRAFGVGGRGQQGN